MPDEFVVNPVPIDGAFGRSDDNSILTIAAFLAATGVWHIAEFESAIPPEDELERLGFHKWPRGYATEQHAFDLREFSQVPSGVLERVDMARDRYYRELGEAVQRALATGRPADSALAVVIGLLSPDGIVRACALSSAVDLFTIRSLNVWQQVSWYAGKALDETTRDLLGIVLWRASSVAANVAVSHQGQGGSAAPAATTAPPGLILVHGTMMPPIRPTWSVPGTGLLFNYLQGQRSDIYGKSDYFRWEGGYSAYAREVAAYNLNDWLGRRNFGASDAVVHSHGCNVLMAAIALGSQFGKVVFLSCPVHWNQYAIPASYYSRAISIRVSFDLVIMADRGAQRFPQSTVPDRILPFWFSHSDPTRDDVWRLEQLYKYL